MQVCHTCDVRNCINPDHLFVGTNRDNVVDMYAKGRNTFVITEEEVQLLHGLRELGYSQSKIARMLGISQTSVSNHLRRGRNE